MTKKSSADLLNEIKRLKERISELEAESSKNDGAEAIINEELKTIKSLLDGSDDVLYVADPETYELLLVNETFKKNWGSDVLGKKCHKVIQGRDKPCPFCTNDKILGEYLGRSYVWEYQDEVTGIWYRCNDRAIDWVDGRKVRVELASDITQVKQTEQKLLEQENALEKMVEERTAKINEELERRKASEKALRESEIVIRTKLKAITEPDADFGSLGLSDIVDIDLLSPIMADFHRITGVANAIIDINGNVLAGAGWQDICTQFHRAHPESLKNCLESDTKLSKGIPEGKFKAYRCKNNLWDMATPIMLEGCHVGNLFIGQYIQTNEIFDETMFHDQAKKHGFDKDAYLDALSRVPRLDSNKVDDIMAFFSKFAKMISKTSLNAIQLSRTLNARERVEEALQRKTSITNAINRIFRETLACDTEEAVAKVALSVAEELTGSKFGFIGEINEDGRFDTMGLSNPGWGNCTMDGSDATLLINDMELMGIWATVLRSGATQIINEPMSHPDSVGTPEGHPPLTSFMGVPFIRHNQAVGMIALANKDGGYNEKDQDAVESLTSPFYEALLRKRLERQVRTEAGRKEALADLAACMSGNQEMEPLCTNIIDYICDRLGAPTGLMYATYEDSSLALCGVHAHRQRKNRSYVFRPGEGLVGQVARNKKSMILEDVPQGYLSVESGLGEIPPQVIYLKPILHEGRVIALLEMGLFNKPDNDQTALIDGMDESIAAAVLSAQSRAIQAQLLEKSQQMTKELQAQQEELKATNEELEEQTQMLTASECRLKKQQEELQASNEELEEKTELLQRTKVSVEEKNKKLDELRKNLEKKAKDLETSSRYKSEFLANMSHELRTPLNSMLLLSKLIADNKEGNLKQDQVESINVIYNSGRDLLSLINEILDLSKIEAGKMQLVIQAISLHDIKDSLYQNFQALAAEKGLSLDIDVQDNLPETIVNDPARILQVLKNFISNAVKFTSQGGVSILFYVPDSDTRFDREDLSAELSIAIDVKDTGIGIPEKKQKQIFEAFQQADGTTTREYGGTGLGLSISRELAKLLGGEIHLKSLEGVGSTFTLYLPIQLSQKSEHDGSSSERSHEDVASHDNYKAPSIDNENLTEQSEPAESDQTAQIHRTGSDTKTLLIIEDDENFAKTLVAFCSGKGFEAVVATSGEEGLKLAEAQPFIGIILDIHLPGISGWQVIELLKKNPATRHIPVHFMSADDLNPEAFAKGAIGFLTKPVAQEDLDAMIEKLDAIMIKKQKDLLLVEDNPGQRMAITKLIKGIDVYITEVDTGEKALTELKQKNFDCMILDLGLPDMTGFDLLSEIEKDKMIHPPPVIVYTAKNLSLEEETKLRRYSDSIIIKGIRSEERLVDETSLFLHRMVASMPEEKKHMICSLHNLDEPLEGKTILLVDDDMRNVFALSKVLTSKGLEIIKAENGLRAIEIIEQRDDINLVLMDIMMPVMDGYEAIKKIREKKRFKKLPILALTAKAMKKDKDDCIAAGANDYLPKPVNIERLLSMIRVWLYN